MSAEWMRLVIEATYLEEEADMAKQFAHLTARQAAELAQTAGVNKLILTHISRRYREKDVFTEAASCIPECHRLPAIWMYSQSSAVMPQMLLEELPGI